MPMIGARFYTQLDAAQLRSDVIDAELCQVVLCQIKIPKYKITCLSYLQIQLWTHIFFIVCQNSARSNFKHNQIEAKLKFQLAFCLFASVNFELHCEKYVSDVVVKETGNP